jgi:hypothetical protein
LGGDDFGVMDESIDHGSGSACGTSRRIPVGHEQEGAGVGPTPTEYQADDVEYVRRVPAPPLDRFIDDIYCLTGVPRHRRLNVPPMPSAHLMINLTGPVHLYDSDPAVPPAVLCDGWFMGVWSRRFTIEHHAPVRLVGVHFKPWGVAPFVDLP